jgi:hypothetical protein
MRKHTNRVSIQTNPGQTACVGGTQHVHGVLQLTGLSMIRISLKAEIACPHMTDMTDGLSS